MTPLPSLLTACDEDGIPGHGRVDDMDDMDDVRDVNDMDNMDPFHLPIFLDDPLIWERPEQATSGVLPLPNLDAATPFLHFSRRPSSSASHRDPSLATVGAKDTPAHHAPKEPPAHREPPPASPQLENALLLFSKPTLTATLLDESKCPVQLEMMAELGGMFFVAEDLFSDEQAERPELTCYRRNLWQCLGNVTFSQQPRYLVDEQGQQLVISQLTTSIIAKESITGNLTDIVSTSWKTTDPATGDALWAMGSPPVCPLTFPNKTNTFYREPHEPKSISLKMAWKRLQFKHSTANNGRRNGPQQHYIVQIHLLAESDVEGCLKVAEIHSNPVIVRGRSPRNFGSHKDVPISRLQKPDKRPFSDGAAPLDEPAQATAPSAPTSHQLCGPSHLASCRPRNNSTGWPPRKRLVTNTDTPVSLLHRFARSPESMANAVSPSNVDSASEILSLSLFDDDVVCGGLENVSPVPSEQTAPASSVDLDVDNDIYYEYFPLGADDWMPSIEAVWCPHVNHSANTGQDGPNMQERARSKRYFTATS